MKALVLTEERALTLVDRPRPEARQPDDVVLRVLQTGVCGTDRGVLMGKFHALPGVIMGHETVGLVHEVGSGVTRLRPGDAVIVNPTLYCGSCPPCLRGRLNHCQNKAGNEVGIDRDGAFAEYIGLPERFCHRTPPGMSPDRAVLAEPLACALNNLEAGGLQAGETVVIVGGGPIGVVCAMAAHFLGAVVLLVEPDPFRNGVCRDVLGNGDGRIRVCLPEDSALTRSGDLVVDAVGNLLEPSLEYAAPCGRVVVMGYHSTARSTITPLDVLQRALRIIGAGDYNSHLFPRAVELARWLPLDGLVTHRFGLAEFGEAARVLALTPGSEYAALKVVISPEPRYEP